MKYKFSVMVELTNGLMAEVVVEASSEKEVIQIIKDSFKLETLQIQILAKLEVK